MCRDLEVDLQASLPVEHQYRKATHSGRRELFQVGSEP